MDWHSFSLLGGIAGAMQKLAKKHNLPTSKQRDGTVVVTCRKGGFLAKGRRGYVEYILLYDVEENPTTHWRNKVLQQEWATPVCIGDHELIVEFKLADMKTAITFLKARKKKKMTREHKEKLAAALQKARKAKNAGK